MTDGQLLALAGTIYVASGLEHKGLKLVIGTCLSALSILAAVFQ